MSKKNHTPGMKLRAYRKAQGLSLAEMAGQIGCSISALSMIERGLRHPKRDLTQAIVTASEGKVRAKDLHPELFWIRA